MQIMQVCSANPMCRDARIGRGVWRGGFTLKELLIVIGIIALLVSILLPTMGRVRKQAKSVQCVANLRSLQAALIGYVNANRRSVDYADINVGNAADVTQNLRVRT